jgi:hypothetical protein
VKRELTVSALTCMRQMSMRTDSADFETTDLSLAAFLLSRGHALLHVGAVGGGRRTFAFPSAVRNEAQAFYQNASVPARAFANALRDLKAMIRQT